MARRKGPVTPYDITVRMHHADDDHYEITIEPAILADEHRDGDDTLAEIVEGARWVAGVACRLAITLAHDLALVAYDHRCQHRDTYGSRCGVNGSHELIAPGADLGDLPSVWIGVPRKHRKTWLATVRASVAEIAAAEARPITDADEEVFRNPPSGYPPSAPATEDESRHRLVRRRRNAHSAAMSTTPSS